jgi:hypothetical protein
VAAERAVDVMVLAVDVARNRATDRDETCAGSDGDEVTAGHDHTQQIIHRHAGTYGDRFTGLVEHDVLGRTGQSQYDAAAVLGGITIRTTEPARERAAV